MALRSFQLAAVAGVVQRLSDVYGDGIGVVNAAKDIPYRQILLQAAVANVNVGDATINVTGTTYGTLIAFGSAVVTSIGPFSTGPVKLSDLFMLGGVNAVLHITAIPY